ncbi:MAG: flagellar assembly protein FliH [Halothiobacillaceae bacterium]|nr:MAG: flagellar assembly protein FliH [Halothiobacillaceae bacterium]
MSSQAGRVSPPRLLTVGSHPVAAWRPPSMDEPAEAPLEQALDEARSEVAAEILDEAPALPTADEIEAIQRAAWDEGYRAGHAEGVAAGQGEVEALAARWRELVDSLAQPLDSAEGDLETALLELTLALTRQLVRRELKTQPDEIIPVVREALNALPSAAREVVVRLHPDDAALVGSTLHSPGSSWRIEEDGAVARGGCVVVSSTSRVDATLDRRIAQLMSNVLGDHREGAA